jgi:hypothetical protein
MEDEKGVTENIGSVEGAMVCAEPLIASLGGSTTLRVPQLIKKQQPNWKKQNPKASVIVSDSLVKLIYEWKAENKVIVVEE